MYFLSSGCNFIFFKVKKNFWILGSQASAKVISELF